jgi:uncharacterized damage-inducible protein DinB
MDQKAILHRYLRQGREALLLKLEGLSEYDARRPLTPTGTNVLGIVKHVASVELGYFAEVFGRPSGRDLPWFADDAEPDSDLWVPADESRESVLELHRFSARHSDATIDALTLDAPGAVPWWSPERRDVTLGQMLVHMCVETARHAGHLDILREQIDGAVGIRRDDPNITPRSAAEWRARRKLLESEAREAQRRADEVPA